MADFDDKGALEHTSDIHVHFAMKGRAYVFGTWRQLQDEGFIPSTEPMPSGCRARWRANDCADFFIERKWVPGSRKRGVKLLESDWWRITIMHDYWTYDRVRMHELHEAVLLESFSQTTKARREREELFRRMLNAVRDESFQAFKASLLPQHRRIAA